MPTSNKLTITDLEFERGYAYGYTRKKRNIHLANFNAKTDIVKLRKEWGINIKKVL